MTTKIRPPGLGGDYADSCVACLRGTDTGLAFAGEAEWSLAGMRVLGIPDDIAHVMLEQNTGCEPGKVPDGDITVALRVCKSCVESTGTGMEVGLVATGVPTYRPRS